MKLYIATIFLSLTMCQNAQSLPAALNTKNKTATYTNPLDRYSLPELKYIWSDDNRFEVYRLIEGYVAEIQGELGTIPKTVAPEYWKKTKVNVARIREIESVVGHETIAFLTSLAEQMGLESKYIHYGITSSDILDTGFNIQVTQSLNLILEKLDAVIKSLEKKALETKNIVAMGRNHGIHAEPLSMGLKFLRYYNAFTRHKKNVEDAKTMIKVCSLSGAMGNLVNISPKVEAYVASKLGFEVEPVATQVIPRDRHAYVFSMVALLASSIEDLATEIRHMQRSEVGEWLEPTESGKTGSRGMAQKKSPILSENLTGLSRLIQSTVVPALRDVPLWHERDLSHSSVERIITPTALILTHFALERLNKVLSGLEVNKERVQDNMRSTSRLFFSQKVLMALVQKGLSREDAYKILRAETQKSYSTKTDLKDALLKNAEIMGTLTAKELDTIFDESYYLTNVDHIFKRVLKK